MPVRGFPVTREQEGESWTVARKICVDRRRVYETGFSNGGMMAWQLVGDCTLPGGTHLPPAGSAPVVWSFLSQFSLP